MNGSVMFISINPIGKLPRQKKNTAQKLVANGAVLGITVEAENDLRHGGCKERIRERGIEKNGDTGYPHMALGPESLLLHIEEFLASALG